MKTRIISWFVTVLFAWAIASAQQPVLKTDRLTYGLRDQIVVEFSGLPGNQTDWITVIGASSPDSGYGQWAYTKGMKSGTMKFQAGNPGNYEVRLFYNYPRGGNIVQARLAFVVKDDASGKTANQIPAATPSRPSAVPASVVAPGGDSASQTSSNKRLDPAGVALPGSRPPHPLTVALTLDGTRSSSADIPLKGGSLTATGSDGTVYTLNIPGDALLRPEHIVMTPIRRLDGMALTGGNLGGVRLEPDGLRLYNFAILTVTPAVRSKGVPLSFSCRGSGEEFHLYPQDLNTAILSFHLLHFSGLVVYMGDNIQLPVSPASFEPTGWEGQFEHGMQQLVGIQKQHELLGTPEVPDFMQTVTDAIGFGYERSVAPLLQRMGTDCAFGHNNLALAQGWAKQAELLAPEGRYSKEIESVEAAYRSLITTCWKELTASCVDKNDIDRKEGIIQLVRLAQLQNFDPAVYNIDAIRWCPPEDPGRWRKVPAWEGTFQTIETIEQEKYAHLAASYTAVGTIVLDECTNQEQLAGEVPDGRQGYSRWKGKITGSVTVFYRTENRGLNGKLYSYREDRGTGTATTTFDLQISARRGKYEMSTGGTYLSISADRVTTAMDKSGHHDTTTHGVPFYGNGDLPQSGLLLSGSRRHKQTNNDGRVISTTTSWSLHPVGEAP